MNMKVNKFNIVCNSFYLSDNISDAYYESWWNNDRINILDKAECGNGGTNGIIQYALNHNKSCVICVPNVGVVTSKEEKYGHDGRFCFGYGDKKIDYSTQIILCTYDKFKEEMSNIDKGVSLYAFKDENGDVMMDSFIWRNRLVVFDEFHKLVDDSGFREICFITTMRILSSSHVLLMSATPNEYYIKLLDNIYTHLKKNREINVYSVKYQNVDIPRFRYNTNGDIWRGGYVDIFRIKPSKATNMGINSLRDAIVHTYNVKVNEEKYKEDGLDTDDLPYKNKHIVIFWNNRGEILDMVNRLGYKDVEVLCSEQGKDNFGEYYSNVFNKDKRVHFLTSAYFTGCDIELKQQCVDVDGSRYEIDQMVDKCFIVGGPGVDCTCYSERDLQQMLGRFRTGVADIKIMYLDINNNIVQHSNLVNNINRTKDKIMVNELKDNGSIASIEDYVQNMVDLIRYTEQKKYVEVWKNTKLLSETISRISQYKGRVMSDTLVKDYFKECSGDYKKHKSLSFREAKNRICDGKTVTLFEYRYSGLIKKYLAIYGVSKTRVASLRDIKDTLDAIGSSRKAVETPEDSDVFFDLLRKTTIEERCNILGIKEGYQPWHKIIYLIEVLEEKKIESYEVNYCLGIWFGMIGVNIPNLRDFNSYILLVKKVCENQDLVHLFVNNNISMHQSLKKTYFKKIDLIKHLDNKVILTIDLKDYQHNHSDKSIYGVSRPLDYLLDNQYFQSLSSYPIYNYVMEDKVNRLPEKKNTQEWKSIKKWKQSWISELFFIPKELNADIRFKVVNLDYANSIILDIDNGMKFSEFKEQYKNIEWYAYPSISNTDYDNWYKFRVIFPNQHPLYLYGENKLTILKILRKNICPFEDDKHGLYSYINQEDLKYMVHNEGLRIAYNQEVVDSIYNLFKGFETYTKNASYLEEESASETTTESVWTIDEAIEYLKAKKKKAAEGDEGTYHFAYDTLFKYKKLTLDKWDELKKCVIDTFGMVDYNTHMSTWRDWVFKHYK